MLPISFRYRFYKRKSFAFIMNICLKKIWHKEVLMLQFTIQFKYKDLGFNKKHAIGHIFNRLPRGYARCLNHQSAKMFILQTFQYAFRKSYPLKLPLMVQQGLLAPQSLLCYTTAYRALKLH